MHIRRLRHTSSLASMVVALLLAAAFTGCKSTPPAPATSAPNSTTPAPGAASPNNAPAGSPASSASATVASVPEKPRPVEVTLTVNSGKDINVRITETVNSKTANLGDRFSGVLSSALTTRSGETVFAKGTPVSGSVVAAKGQGRFAGSGVLAIELKEVAGHPVAASEYIVSKKGKGKRSAALIGGGAGAGALIGGLAGGGKGALFGALIGGGAGTAGAGFTGNKPLIIPSESIVVFELTQPLSKVVER